MTAPLAHTRLADLANLDFTSRQGHDDPQVRDDRHRAMPPARYLIGTSAAGMPTTLAVVTSGIVHPPAPAVVVPGSATLQEVIEESALLNLLELSPEAAVVMEHGSRAVRGVLERATIDAYLRQDRFPGGPTRTGAGTVAGDDGCLCGSHRTPHAHVICAFTDCGRVNALHFYDPEDPPMCPGPGGGVPVHPLPFSVQGEMT